MPPVDKPGSAHVVVMLQSPRDAAARAIVYRRRLRGRPPERALRSVGLIGTLLVHLVFLFGAVLGSAYELKPAPESPQQALQVRLIDKPEPPPPPPVRGTPPKQVGPTRRGNAAVRRPVSRAQAVMPSPPQPPVAIPAPDLPAIARTLGARGRIHFAHCRNVHITGPRRFHEAPHPTALGDVDMRAVLAALRDTGFDGPMRPDHGRMIWGERGRPGYGLHDRALGATYLYGLWEGLTGPSQ